MKMYYGHMGFFGGVGMLIVWGGFLVLIIWLINQNKDRSKSQITPKKILQKRLAKGDITEKEFDKLNNKLNNKRSV